MIYTVSIEEERDYSAEEENVLNAFDFMDFDIKKLPPM
jgi:hypothetical protein